MSNNPVVGRTEMHSGSLCDWTWSKLPRCVNEIDAIYLEKSQKFRHWKFQQNTGPRFVPCYLSYSGLSPSRGVK